MAGPVDILELMLNTSKQRRDYVTSTEFEDENGNIDINELIDDNLKRKESLAIQASDTRNQLSNIISQTIESGNKVKDARDSAMEARANIFPLATEEQALTADIGRAELDELLLAEEQIRISSDEFLNNTNQLQDRARKTTAELFVDIDIIDEARDLGLVDFITNPIRSVTKNVAANQAENRVVRNREELGIIAAQQQFEAQSAQAESSVIRQKAELIATASVQDRYARLDVTNALTQANLQGEFSEAAVADAAAVYELDKQHTGFLQTKLNSLISEGNATTGTVNTAIAVVRNQQATTQYAQIQEISARQEADRLSLESKFLNTAEALDLPYDSFGEYTIARSQGLVTKDVEALIAQTMYNGLVGASAVSSSIDPVGTYESIVTVVGPLALTPAFDVMMARVDAIAAQAAIPENIVNPRDTPREIRAKHNKTMTTFFQSIPEDFNTLYKNQIAKLFSPHQLDYTASGGLLSFPTGAVAEVSKWNLDTSSLGRWVEGALNYSRDSELPPSIIASAMAAISVQQFEGVKLTLGLNTQRMSTRSLGNNAKSIGDATNPGDWLTAIEIERVGKITRAEAARVAESIGALGGSVIE